MKLMVLVTLGQNVPLTSRNNKRGFLCLGLMMMNLKINLMLRLLSMLLLSLEDGDLMKNLVM